MLLQNAFEIETFSLKFGNILLEIEIVYMKIDIYILSFEIKEFKT